MPCRCVVTPSAVLPCLPTPGLPEQVEGAQLQRKLENDVHCDYERASWSGLFHRALGLSPAVLHRLKSEGARSLACMCRLIPGLHVPSRFDGACAHVRTAASHRLVYAGLRLRRRHKASAACPAAPADVKDYFPHLPEQLHLDPMLPLPLRLNHFQSKTCEGPGSWRVSGALHSATCAGWGHAFPHAASTRYALQPLCACRLERHAGWRARHSAAVCQLPRPRQRAGR